MRGGVELNVWNDFPRHFRETYVLDDESVDSGFADQAELSFGRIDFTSEDEGVHRDEAPDSVLVEVGYEFGEIVFAEIVGA